MKKLFIVFALLCVASSCVADPPPPQPPPSPSSPSENYSDAMGVASVDFLKGEYDEAITELAEAVSLAKTNDEKATALFQMGNMYLVQKKFAEARKVYAEVLTMNPIKPVIKGAVLMPYADSYSAEGKYHEARVEYNQMLSIANLPASFRFYAQRKKVETYLSARQYAQAREESAKLNSYKKLFAVTGVVAAYYIGESYLDEGNFKNARKQFAKAIDVTKNDLQQEDGNLFDIYQQQARLGIGESYFKEKKYDKAKAEYNTIIRMNLWGKFKTEAKERILVIEKLQKKK